MNLFLLSAELMSKWGNSNIVVVKNKAIRERIEKGFFCKIWFGWGLKCPMRLIYAYWSRLLASANKWKSVKDLYWRLFWVRTSFTSLSTNITYEFLNYLFPGIFFRFFNTYKSAENSWNLSNLFKTWFFLLSIFQENRRFSTTTMASLPFYQCIHIFGTRKKNSILLCC